MRPESSTTTRLRSKYISFATICLRNSGGLFRWWIYIITSIRSGKHVNWVGLVEGLLSAEEILKACGKFESLNIPAKMVSYNGNIKVIE